MSSFEGGLLTSGERDSVAREFLIKHAIFKIIPGSFKAVVSGQKSDLFLYYITSKRNKQVPIQSLTKILLHISSMKYATVNGSIF